MDERQRFIIKTNEKLLRDNCQASSLIPHLIQDLVLTFDDDERITVMPTRDDKAKTLLRILETRPNGYNSFLKALRAEKQDFLVEALEKTEVDEEYLNRIKDGYDQLIRETVLEVYCCTEESSQYILLENIEEEVRFEFLKHGEKYNINLEHLKNLVHRCFPTSTPHKRKKSKIWAFKCLKRKQPIDEGNPELVIPDFSNIEKSTNPVINQKPTESTCGRPCHKKLCDLNEKELANVLKPRLSKFGIPEDVLETIIEEEINGNVFSRLELKHMGDMFPYLKKGKLMSLVCIKDDIKKEEEQLETSDVEVFQMGKVEDNTVYKAEMERFQSGFSMVDEEFSHSQTGGQYRERFRKFDTDATQSDTYRRGAILTTFNNRPSNLLEPVHVFSMLDSSKENISYKALSDEVIDFVAACLNGRTNGTIHIGVKPKMTDLQIEGEVCGIVVNVYHCLRQLYKRMDERFYREQLGVITQCLRTPQFVDVISKENPHVNLRVLEVDVVPISTLVTDEVFFTRSSNYNEGKPVLYMFNGNGVVANAIHDERTLTFLLQDKLRFSDARKSQENHPKLSTVKTFFTDFFS